VVDVDGAGEEPPPDGGAVRNTLSGDAHNVVQARDIGSLHFHTVATDGLPRRAMTVATAAVLAAGVTVAATWRHGPPEHHGPAVKVDSVSVQRTPAQAGIYVFPGSLRLAPAELASLNRLRNGDAAYDAWFTSRGGVDPFLSKVQLIVRGNADQPARITDIAVDKTCRAPLDGTLFDSPTAGNDSSILINFDLDAARSVAEAPGGGDFFARHTISLRPGEVQAIEITSVTGHHFCRYTLRLTVLVGDRRTVQTVSDHGRPFQVTAKQPHHSRYHALYVGGVASPAGDKHSFVREDPATYPDE
jgi:hypothetical protein